MNGKGMQPKFTITNAITEALTGIERARGFLEASTLSDDWIRAMSQRALILEAHHTTHIEGTQLTLEQAEQLLDGESVQEANPDDTLELLNYRRAFEFVSEYLNSGAPITEALIREIHKYLVEGVRGGEATPGAYRKIQNYVINSATKETIYTPPPAHEIPVLMTELTSWLNNEEKTHPVLISGVAQFQLVHIHPFLDGNGRTSRLLSTLCLYRTGYDFKQLFTISEYYDRNLANFYRAIQSVRENDMDMTEWLEYFVEGLSAQMGEVKKQGEIIIRTDILLKEYNLSERQARVLKQVLKYGSITIHEYEHIFQNVNRRSLQRDIKEMTDKGLLSVHGSSATDPTKRYYLAERVKR